jgi:hypothetical protein
MKTPIPLNELRDARVDKSLLATFAASDIYINARYPAGMLAFLIYL